MSRTHPVVVVTRAEAQAEDLVALLEERGAEVRVMPVIRIVEPSANNAMVTLASTLSSYEWVVVTSPNTVSRLSAVAPVAPEHLRVAAIGPGTAQALRDADWPVHLVAEPHVAEALVDAFPEGTGRVAIPRAAVARDVLPIGLEAKGWTVDLIEAYRTVPVSHRPEAIEVLLRDADFVTFTASSTVRAFVEQVPMSLIPAGIVCIGPITAATAVELGLQPTVVASTHTISGLVDELFAALSAP